MQKNPDSLTYGQVSVDIDTEAQAAKIIGEVVSKPIITIHGLGLNHDVIEYSQALVLKKRLQRL